MARWVRLLVGLPFLAFVAIGFTNLIPDDPILDHLTEDLRSESIRASNTPVVRGGGSSDRFGECVLATVGVSDSSDTWFDSIGLSPNLGHCGRLTEELELRELGQTTKTIPKVRYMNGLSVIARPFLWLGGIDTLRVGGLLALVSAMLALGFAGSRVAGWPGGLALVAPILATGDIAVLLDVFHHPMMLAVGLGGVAAALVAAANGASPMRLAEVAFVAGSAYSFVDLMNFVPGVWLLFGGGVAVALPATSSLRSRAVTGAASTIAWALGYAWMWIMAWVFAAVASSPSAVWDEISEQIGFRVNGESTYATGDFGAGATAVIDYWLDRPFAKLFVVLAVTIGGLMLVQLRRDSAGLRGTAVTLAPTLLFVPWVLGTNNHHEIHYWIEYRSLPLLAGLGLFAGMAARTGRFSSTAG